MEEPNNSAYRKEEEKNPIVVFFLNLLGAIKLPFPQQKNGGKVEAGGASSGGEGVEPAVVEDESNKPGVVTFPRQSFPPLKLEAEAEDGERSTNPVLLWQVYAIGGFFVLRWAWTRWNERKGPKKSDDEPPPAHD
ncbi:hypothetical protein Salat_0752900 [Sesamum alatum]|uniref:Uncharacterized protein n=1 Tax=Sesamum alatum TaxID=300844 RepID=A0AAE1YTP2_9LAMI|nr:hypothetical protein Salat_0752900 [Sesamum alatum]